MLLSANCDAAHTARGDSTSVQGVVTLTAPRRCRRRLLEHGELLSKDLPEWVRPVVAQHDLQIQEMMSVNRLRASWL